MRASDRRMAANRSDPNVAACETGSAVLPLSGWLLSVRISITFKLGTKQAITPALVRQSNSVVQGKAAILLSLQSLAGSPSLILGVKAGESGAVQRR